MNTKIRTLGDLKKSGYTSKTVKDELRENLIARIKEGKPVFKGVLGYEETVLPALERAILSRHSINLLGLRGQAKTRIARQMIDLLDEYIPVVAGSDINDDPLHPISHFAQELIAEHGDNTPIEWMHRSDRYTEKLATPDVTVADLIGDSDPIKAANLKLDYSDERVIHFGLVPRSHRGIFVINELPDLQPRIQVALFNILQEGDIQIRGFKLRLPLDIQFVFTANPEDYTNRGAIITPLKDRIQSQIITHYPTSIEISREITLQEASISKEQQDTVIVPDLVAELLEQVAMEARASEMIDQKSGVSARLTISAYESLVSAAERRLLRNGESQTMVRLGDILAVVPAITGKVELVYEGEQEGAEHVTLQLIGKAIRTHFPQHFPDPEMIKRRKMENPYQQIVDWFSVNELNLTQDMDAATFAKALNQIPNLHQMVEKYKPGVAEEEKLIYMEFLLHGLAEFSLLSKNILGTSLSFSDLMNSMFSFDEEEE